MTNKFLFQIFICIKRLKRYYAWHKGVKSLKRFIFPLLNVLRLISDRLNGNLIKATFILVLRLDRLRSRSGITYVSTYLKACHIYTMQYISTLNKHSHIHSSTYGLHVKLTKSGLPRILPVYLRQGLRARNQVYIKIVLTIFNLYRVLPFLGKVKLSTITDEFAGQVSQDLLAFIPRFWKLIRPPKFSWKWEPYLISSSGAVVRDPRQNSTSGFFKALCELRRRPELWNAIKWFFERAPAEYGFKEENKTALIGLLSIADKLANSPAPPIPLGKLAFKDEPGKVRVFAMVDCVTQWVLRPLHDWIFEVLRKIPTDATFDQEGGVEKIRLKILERSREGKCPVFSLDLSAATDRLPIVIQIPLLERIRKGLGLSWATLLIKRAYIIDTPNLKKYCISYDNSTVYYGTGQPMGANSSWGMLAITHHFIVQFCAWKIYNNQSWYQDYMILGDDIIILDPKVAKFYLRIMQQLCVGINLSKSLISTIGYAEFAKKFITPKGRVEGLSLKEFSSLGNSFSNIVNLAKRLSSRRVNMLRLLGFGPISAGRSLSSFLRRSHRSFLDHLFCSPLVDTKIEWFNWLSMITSEWKDELMTGLPLLKYTLFSYENKRFALARQIVSKVYIRRGYDPYMIPLQPHLDDRLRGLLSFWLPPSFQTEYSLDIDNVWFKDCTRVLDKKSEDLLEFFEKNIYKIFKDSPLLTDLALGVSKESVEQCLPYGPLVRFDPPLPKWSICTYRYYEAQSQSDWWLGLNTEFRALMREDIGHDIIDLDKVMEQVHGEKDLFHPCSIKDISKALFFKDEVINALWREKDVYSFSVPGVRYPKIWRTKKS